MFAGIQELLLPILIIMAIIMLPRITGRGKNNIPLKSLQSPQLPYFSGKLRLAIVSTILWPAIVALYLNPWNTGWKTFIIIGLGPVVIMWCLVWIIAGYKKQ
jgi:hypothetical protein